MKTTILILAALTQFCAATITSFLPNWRIDNVSQFPVTSVTPDSLFGTNGSNTPGWFAKSSFPSLSGTNAFTGTNSFSQGADFNGICNFTDDVNFSGGVLGIEADFAGNVNATSFSGQGTGLTGTAAGLTAGNATLAAGLSATLDVAHGGTGRTTGVSTSSIVLTGGTATGPQQTLTNGAAGDILTSTGPGATPSWLTGTGSGLPVKNNSPTLVTPVLGTPASGNLVNCTGYPAASLTGTTLASNVVSSSLTSHGTLNSFAANIGSNTGSFTWGTGSWTANTSGYSLQTSGTGYISISSNAQGTMDGIAIGQVVPKQGNFTSVNASTSFSGPGTGLTGTAASLTAGTVTTNANLTGAVISTGNATSLGLFSSSQLRGAITDESGTGAALFDGGTAGTLTITALTAGSIVHNPASSFSWLSSTRLFGDTDGLLRVTNNAQTAGITADVTTDGTVKFRNRANSADATVTGAFNGTLGATTPGTAAITSGTFTGEWKSTTAITTPASFIATTADFYATTTRGAVIHGFGSTNDVSIVNRNGNVAIGVTANTSDVAFGGKISVPGGIVGTTAGGNAAAGNVGEYVQSLVASGSAVGLTTATAANVTSISLTAGDWDVSGNVNYSATLATITQKTASIGTTSATLNSDGSECFSGAMTTTANSSDTVQIPRNRISVSSTTTVYLVGRSTFSSGTVSAYGSISARRIR